MDARPVEPRMTSFLFAKASRMKIPISGTFELSPICNFSCKMCYVRKTQAEVNANPRRIMTVSEWLSIAREAREAGLLYLLLTGGEPLLWPDFWELYETLSSMGFLISINSNGSLIDEQAVARFRKNPPCRINITLYGTSENTYRNLCRAPDALSRVKHAIALLKEAHIPIKLNGSMTPENIGDLPELVGYAASRDLIFEPVTYMFPPVRRDCTMTGQNERFTPEEAAHHNAEAFRLLYGEDAYRRRMESILKGTIPPPGLDESCIDPADGTVRCRAGKAAFWITWDGLMTPCGMMNEPTVDIREGTFRESWDKLVTATEQLHLSGVCSKCKNKNLCHACAAMASAETGSFSGIPTYLCEMVQAMKALAQKELQSP